MKNKKHAKRIKKLALICTLCTIILVVSTYAWFIGMKTVNVSSFDVEIAATDGLSLSLDGQTWAETVEINKDNYSTTYTGNTNTWGGTDENGNIVGLIPVSTVGQIDSTSSRLVLFEKGSLTATDGGYRLMASRVNNTTVTAGEEEGTGYVAFDLFIKNLSGDEYYTDFNQLNEEAIYLTQDSAVSVVSTGSDNQDKTGIENSVRVAFAQIGRVIATTESQDTITGITCETKNGVTGICTRYAQIWEPNDTAHVANAINWYDTACKLRTGEDLTSSSSYTQDNPDTDDVKESACSTVANGSYAQTYTVGNTINYDNYIDVYDGAAYNKYTTSISSTKVSANTLTTTTDVLEKAEGKLYEYDYFTDTEKMLIGMDRPTFITLAPNSITKVRVYIYIEGQDVDNYDFASLGKKIQVNFGFTKERFFAEDIDYEGPMTAEKQDTTISVPTRESQS